MSTVSGTTKNGAQVDVQVYESTVSIKKAESFSPFIVCESKIDMSDSDQVKILEKNYFIDTKVIDGKTYDLVTMNGSRCAYYLPSTGKRSMRALEMGRMASEFLEEKTSASDQYKKIDQNQLFMDSLGIRLEERAKQLGCDLQDLTEEDITACSEEVQKELPALILEKAIDVTEENDAEAMQYQAELQKKIDTNDYSPETINRLEKATEIDKTIQTETASAARVLGGSRFEKDFGNDRESYFKTIYDSGHSGDIGTYWTTELFGIRVCHSHIWSHGNHAFLTSGSSANDMSSSASSSTNSEIHGCQFVPGNSYLSG